jgi:hypothetical protein
MRAHICHDFRSWINFCMELLLQLVDSLIKKLESAISLGSRKGYEYILSHLDFGPFWLFVRDNS